MAVSHYKAAWIGKTPMCAVQQTSGGNLNLLATPLTHMAVTWLGNA